MNVHPCIKRIRMQRLPLSNDSHYIMSEHKDNSGKIQFVKAELNMKIQFIIIFISIFVLFSIHIKNDISFSQLSSLHSSVLLYSISAVGF